MTDPNELLTVAEACAYLKQTKGWLAQRRYTAQPPSYIRLSPKSILYRRSDIDSFLAASERTGTAVAA